MSLHVSLIGTEAAAVITRGDGLVDEAWSALVGRARDIDVEAVIAATAIKVTWPSFLYLTQTIRYLQGIHGFRTSYDGEARARLQTYVSEVAAVRQAQDGLVTSGTADIKDRSSLEALLVDRGWSLEKRSLKDEQVRDVLRMLGLNHGANFSVPGAGKTTVALALHLAGMPADSPVLVIAPKNAFPAWDEVLRDCLTDPPAGFTRLTGGRANVEKRLAEKPMWAIISYGQLLQCVDLIVDLLTRMQVHVIVDESHRIKAGAGSLTGAAVLRLAFASRRDILSGTPMPNAISDLSPQFDFLYPAHGFGAQIAASTSPGSIVRPFYVRTTKHELGLEPPVVGYPAVEMSDPQRLIYAILRDDIVRSYKPGIAQAVPPGQRVAVMRLLQAAIDPQAAVMAMLAGDIGRRSETDEFRTICRLVLEENVSPRMATVEAHVRSLAAEGRKVVVWAPFRHTIGMMTGRLEDLGAMAIHGGVDSGDVSEEDTREWIVEQFHSNPDAQVLVANPAAGGEGISLHHVCHDAIYVGRTYNAAHYLQSRDRIHRLGLEPGTVTRIWVYESMAPARLGSIDMSVRRRLDLKVRQAWQVLEDDDLQRLSLESDVADPDLDDGLSGDDVMDLINQLTSGGASDAA